MPRNDIDAYLANVPEPQRSTLEALRKTIHSVLPRAEECITYNVPTFKVDGRSIAGFASYKNHCSYFPMSGATLTTLKDDVEKYVTTKGALRFPIDKPLPTTLVKKLIKARLQEEASKSGSAGPSD
ncbi:intracellular iron chaperone frataxin [mine drainage metagenome]|uniref:Intracellular iron chaperone frataxin n=1 Tax=mine drainage metagenome TaxID=410659 RepID=A0A1J5QM75_9ZZZZ